MSPTTRSSWMNLKWVRVTTSASETQGISFENNVLMGQFYYIGSVLILIKTGVWIRLYIESSQKTSTYYGYPTTAAIISSVNFGRWDVLLWLYCMLNFPPPHNPWPLIHDHLLHVMILLPFTRRPWSPPIRKLTSLTRSVDASSWRSGFEYT